MKRQQSIANSVKLIDRKNKKQHWEEDVPLMENKPQNKTLSSEKIIMTDNISKNSASGYDSSWIQNFTWHISKKALNDNITGNHLNDFFVIKQI